MIFEDYLYWLNEEVKSQNVQNHVWVGTLTKYGLYGTAFMKFEQVRLLPRVTSNELQRVHLQQLALQPRGNFSHNVSNYLNHADARWFI